MLFQTKEKRSALTILLPLCVFLTAILLLPFRSRESPFQRQVVFSKVNPVSGDDPKQSKSDQTNPNDSEHYLILAAGMMRSGSTWQYNALRLLMHNLTDVVSGWIGDVQNVKQHKYALVKIHFHAPLMNDPIWTKVLTFTSHRDIRDVCASQFRAHNETPCVLSEAYINSHKQLSNMSIYDMSYEHFIQNPAQVVISMAEVLKNNLPGFQWNEDLYTVNRIIEVINTQAKALSEGQGLNATNCTSQNWGCMYDKSTNWHVGHITDGKWGSFKKMFKDLPNGKELCLKITNRREGWLRAHSYPLTEACDPHFTI